ncbi:hypothetical protein D3C76_1663180 [compost metagenome]
MRNIGQHLLPVLLILKLQMDRMLQPFAHLLESFPHFAEFILALHEERTVQLAFLDAFRRTFERV